MRQSENDKLLITLQKFEERQLVPGKLGKMVIKTDGCAFCEYRIFPGHGARFARRDGQLVIVDSSKCKSLYLQRKKPAKLVWTQAWRRLNKKGKTEEVSRRRARRTVRFQKPIIGVSVDELRKKRAQKSQAERSAARPAAKEIKERKKAQRAASKQLKAKQSGQKAAKKMGGAKPVVRGKM